MMAVPLRDIPRKVARKHPRVSQTCYIRARSTDSAVGSPPRAYQQVALTVPKSNLVSMRKAVDMKLGMNTFFISMLDFEEGLQFCQEQGVQAVEVAAVGPAARTYCDVDRLLADRGELERWLDIYAAHGLEIYSFAGHGTPLVPDRRIAQEYSRQFRKTCALMERVGCTRLVVVAGLPEGAEGDSLPAWIVNTDLPFLRDALEWQWERRLIP